MNFHYSDFIPEHRGYSGTVVRFAMARVTGMDWRRRRRAARLPAMPRPFRPASEIGSTGWRRRGAYYDVTFGVSHGCWILSSATLNTGPIGGTLDKVVLIVCAAYCRRYCPGDKARCGLAWLRRNVGCGCQGGAGAWHGAYWRRSSSLERARRSLDDPFTTLAGALPIYTPRRG